MGFLDSIKEANEKIQKDAELKRQNLKEANQARAETEMEKGNLICDINSDIETLTKQNIETMMAIHGHEAGSSWAKWSAILSMKPEAQAQAMLLKSISEEQKILIRQNEIIIQLLSKMAK